MPIFSHAPSTKQLSSTRDLPALANTDVVEREVLARRASVIWSVLAGNFTRTLLETPETATQPRSFEVIVLKRHHRLVYGDVHDGAGNDIRRPERK
jgi:hypothetical protein